MSADDHGDDLLSPVQTRQLLGVSRTRVLQFEERGELHSVRDARGVHWYSRGEVERLIRLRMASPDARVTRVGAKLPGETVARVFELFDEGWTLPQIVRETKLPPEAIRALHVEYRTPVDQPAPAAPRPSAPAARTHTAAARGGRGAHGRHDPLVRLIAGYDPRLVDSGKDEEEDDQ